MRHLFQNGVIVANVGLYQALQAVVIQRAQVLGQFAAVITVQGRAQTLFNDADGLGNAAAFERYIAARQSTASGRDGTQNTVIQQTDQLVLVNRVHTGFHIDPLVSGGCAGVVGGKHAAIPWVTCSIYRPLPQKLKALSTR